MSTDLEKIWAVPINVMWGNSTAVRKISYHLQDNSINNRGDASQKFNYPDGQRLPSNLVPDYIFFDRDDLTEAYRSKLPDWFVIQSNIFVVSEKFSGLLLSRFDLGANELFEVPLYEFDQATQRPGRWYIFHICQAKDTLVAEKSVGLQQNGRKTGFWTYRSGEGELAVRASAAVGADIWIDLHMSGAFFLSERLLAALKPAGIRAPGIPFRPCTVVA